VVSEIPEHVHARLRLTAIDSRRVDTLQLAQSAIADERAQLPHDRAEAVCVVTRQDQAPPRRHVGVHEGIPEHCGEGFSTKT
jgi:hypothetical protein